MSLAIDHMLELAGTVFEQKGHVMIHAGGEAFRVYTIQLSSDGSALFCQAPGNDGALVIAVESVTALAEIPEAYP